MSTDSQEHLPSSLSSRQNNSKFSDRQLIGLLLSLQIVMFVLLVMGWATLNDAIETASYDNASQSTAKAALEAAETAAKEAASAHCWAKKAGQNYADIRAQDDANLMAMRLGIYRAPESCD